MLNNLMQSILEEENSGRCLMASKTSSRNILRRYLQSGYLVEPYYGLYTRAEHWNKLLHKDKILHIALSLQEKIKILAWKFTGETGAAMLNLNTVNTPNNYGKPTKIYVSCPYEEKYPASKNSQEEYARASRQLQRIHLPDIIEDELGLRLETFNFAQKKSNNKQQNLPTTNFGHLETPKDKAMQHVASIYNILFACAWTLPFRRALPIFDSAARNNVDLEKVYKVCSEFYGKFRYQYDAPSFQDVPYLKDKHSIISNVNECDILARLLILCRLANGKSENSGESLARATMIELGFKNPELQREFFNKNNPEWPYRVDFAWEDNKKLIVGELDGTDKYLAASWADIDSIKSNEIDTNGKNTNGKNTIGNVDKLTNNNLHDGNSLTDSFESSILHYYDRDAVRREHKRERFLLNCGVSNIVRFDFTDVVDPKKLENLLLDAGVPKISY